jgi:hypothetical protein
MIGLTLESREVLIIMALQTTTHVSLLQKLLLYFDIAATIGTEIPEPHVQLISGIIDVVIKDIEAIKGGAVPLQLPAPVSDPTLPNHAALSIVPVVEVKKEPPIEIGGGVPSVTVALGTTTPTAESIERPHDGISPVVP